MPSSPHIVDHSFDALRTAPLSFFWDAPYEQYEKAFDLPTSLPEKTKAAVGSMISAGIVTASEGLGRRIAYSRDRNFYAANSRYVGTEYTYGRVLAGIDVLLDRGVFVEHDRRLPGNQSAGTQSSFLPSAALASMTMPVRRKTKELVRMKDENKHLYGYKDTERTCRERDTLRAFNEIIADVEVDYVPLAGRYLPNGSVLTDLGTIVNLLKRELYSVYNNKSWADGGRMFGPWWQALNWEERLRVTMDGECVCEEDYSQIHPTMMYHAAGLKIDRDAYTVEGYGPEWHVEWRDRMKKIFNTMLNARCWASAHGSIKHELDLSDQEATDVIRAVKAAHPDIKHLFHSGLGLKLQGIDAAIAKGVMTDLMIKRGIPIFPIHDSFLAPASKIDVLRESMDRCFQLGLSRVLNIR